MPAIRYKPRKISEINVKSDDRIAVMGDVVELGENSFILDDGSAKAEIVFEGELKKKQMVRVFCSIVENQLKADVVQNLDGLDLNLYKKIDELYQKAGL
ncbi:MAG TPA: hypothetical protein VJ343_00975 [archaeon]|nr:hypothetical protein [archaeon]